MNHFKPQNVLAGLFVSIICVAVFSAAEESDKIIIQKINIETRKDEAVVSFVFSQPAEVPSTIQLSDPYRLVIETAEKNIFYDKKELRIQRGLVRTIRFELKNSPLVSKEVDYIALDIAGPFSYVIASQQNGWRIVIKQSVREDKTIKPIQQVESPLTVQKAVAIAYSNYVPAQTAREKIDLARMRKWEALRTLFPSLTAKYEQTTGESRGEKGSTQLFGYKEKFLSFQFAQPLYQGGKLRATYEQTCLNYELAELQYKKIIQELEFEVRKAFYQAAQYQNSVSLYQQALEDVDKDLKTAEKLYDQKLSTRVEYLNVQSKHNQLTYQHASLAKDLELAQAQLLQLLNVDTQQLPVVVPVESHGELDISLEKLQRQMRLNQPDIMIAEREAKLSELGKTIGRSGNDFRLELTGSVGRSASHYETETLEWKDDFSAGVRLSKPYGGNTLSSSYLYDDTSPKLGQSSRTLSKTGSAQLGILDNLKALSDSKESDIAFKESAQKLIDERRSAVIEVKKNFYNYQKSLIQLNGIQKEVKLHQEELIITRQKKELNMAQLSEVVDMKVRLAGSQSSLQESLAFYLISIAGINKSIGLPDQYKLEADMKEEE